MSVRIHAIAKETNKTSKEVLEILVERGYDVKSASSTIDNITAQSLIDEFNKAPVPADETDAPKVEQAKDKPAPKEVPFVKTKQDLDREKEEKEKAEQAEKDAAALARQEALPPSLSLLLRKRKPGLQLLGQRLAFLRHRLRVRVPLHHCRLKMFLLQFPNLQHHLRMIQLGLLKET